MKTLKRGQIDCPSCGSMLKIDELLISNFEKSIRTDLQGELRRREEELQEHKNEVLEMSLKLEREKEDVNQLVNEKVKSQLHSREEKLKAEIRKEVQDEKTLELSELEAELMRKSSQLKDMNQTKAKIARLSREFEEREAEIHLQKENELTERLKSMESSIKEKLQMESFLKIKEKENIIESLKNKLDDARQKATQGSMQNQGEAQELVLEQLLREAHPNDLIQEVGKGKNGADCCLLINTLSGVAGSILFESKNTKSFSNEFIKKLKQDNLSAKADLMVIVTKTMPKEGANDKYCLIDGVWITTMEGVRDLSLILRFGLLKTHAVMLTQSGKADKMSLLYNYLTSQEFKATFENILSGFKLIEQSHHDEKNKMQLLWKKREKYLESVLSSTIDFYGSIKGISENVPDIQMLEFENKKAS